MKYNDPETLLKLAADSQKMGGWNDRLEWLIQSTLAAHDAALCDEDLEWVAAGTAPQQQANPKQTPQTEQ